jgi:uncharacterized protein YmfQ (DUF2313 family)
MTTIYLTYGFRPVSVEEALAALWALMPPGPIWERGGDSRLDALLEGLAAELAELHSKVSDLVDEFDPRTTVDLLEDWERVAGLPEHCDPTPSTVSAVRRQLLAAKVAAVGGQHPGYYKAIADTATGEDCTITEYTGSVFRASVSHAGDPLYGRTWRYWWQVSIPNVDPSYFSSGRGAAGGALATYPSSVSQLACMLDRLRPAHTRVFYDFPDDDPLT